MKTTSFDMKKSYCNILSVTNNELLISLRTTPLGCVGVWGGIKSKLVKKIDHTKVDPGSKLNKIPCILALQLDLIFRLSSPSGVDISLSV